MGLCMTHLKVPSMTTYLHTRIQALDGLTQERVRSDHGEFSIVRLKIYLPDGEITGVLIANGTMCMFDKDAEPLLLNNLIPYYEL